MKVLLLLPTFTLAKHYLTTYNCNDSHDRCRADVYVPEIPLGSTIPPNLTTEMCNARLDSCNDCASREYQCRVDAGDVDVEQANCTKEAQICYQRATSPGTTIGYYTCIQAHKSCLTAPMKHDRLCRDQLWDCRKCQTKEKDCRFFGGREKCDEAADKCFEAAMGKRLLWQEVWSCWSVGGNCVDAWGRSK